MDFILNPRGASCTLQITVNALEEASIRMTGIDNQRANSKYFDRRAGSRNKPVLGVRTFNFPMPLSPNQLKVRIINELTGDSNELELVEIKALPLKKPGIWIKNRHQRFLEFAVEFCQKAGYTKECMHYSEDREFVIEYTDYIPDRKTGKPMFTPARVRRDTGYTELARSKFKDYSIPMRLMILLHERMHFEYNTTHEIQADLTALRIYLANGFPATEANYAVTKIFYDRPDMIERVREINAFIKDFQNLDNTALQPK